MANRSNEVSLIERLQGKMQADRERIEHLTRSELEQLAQSLQQQSSTVLRITLNAMEREVQHHATSIGGSLEQIERRLMTQQHELRRLTRRVTWLLSLCLITLTALLVLMLFG